MTERGFEREPCGNHLARGDLGQRPLLPGHAIAGWGLKTSIVTLPVVMLKARATSRISFAMGSLLSQKAILVTCREGMRAFNPELGRVAEPLLADMKWAPTEADLAKREPRHGVHRGLVRHGEMAFYC
jgi:hypothetical protein